MNLKHSPTSINTTLHESRYKYSYCPKAYIKEFYNSSLMYVTVRHWAACGAQTFQTLRADESLKSQEEKKRSIFYIIYLYFILSVNLSASYFSLDF